MAALRNDKKEIIKIKNPASNLNHKKSDIQEARRFDAEMLKEKQIMEVRKNSLKLKTEIIKRIKQLNICIMLFVIPQKLAYNLFLTFGK